MKTPILAALLAATITTPAAAVDAPELSDLQRADLRCFLGMTAMSRNDTYKEWGTFGIFFYTGRLKARDPTLDFAAAIRREYPRMPAAQYNDEIKRCNEELGQVSRDLESLKRAVPRGTGR